MKAIISGGGTGGHIFPAIAIANALKAADPTTEILFVGADGRMEMEKVPQAGYKIQGLWISGLQRKLTIDNLSFPFKVVHSLVESVSILRKFRPDVVIGVGGYASGAVLQMAQILHIPTVIQEQNCYAGITNKLLAREAVAICTAYEECERFFDKDKIHLTGNPVRQDIVMNTVRQTEAYSFFNLDPFKKTVLVLGGSLGARTLNEAMIAAAATWAAHTDDVQIIWQTGKNYYDDIAKTELITAPNIRIYSFLSRMDLAYAAADIIVSRAGASSVSELCVVGKPVVLVPSPNVAEDHQTKNAMSLVNKNAAVLVRDAAAKTDLVNAILALIQDKNKQTELSENIQLLAKPNAAQDIVAVIYGVIRSGKP